MSNTTLVYIWVMFGVSLTFIGMLFNYGNVEGLGLGIILTFLLMLCLDKSKPKKELEK